MVWVKEVLGRAPGGKGQGKPKGLVVKTEMRKVFYETVLRFSIEVGPSAAMAVGLGVVGKGIWHRQRGAEAPPQLQGLKLKSVQPGGEFGVKKGWLPGWTCGTGGVAPVSPIHLGSLIFGFTLPGSGTSSLLHRMFCLHNFCDLCFVLERQCDLSGQGVPAGPWRENSSIATGSPRILGCLHRADVSRSTVVFVVFDSFERGRV